mgnify:CR=1 FL=1
MTDDMKQAAYELAERFNELGAHTQADQYGALMEFVVTPPEALDLFKEFVYSATDALPDNVIPFLRYM